MASEPFDAVLAEAERGTVWLTWESIRVWRDRLAAAHEREVDNLRRVTRHEHIAAEDAIKRAEAAEGLLREVVRDYDRQGFVSAEHLNAIDANLSGGEGGGES